MRSFKDTESREWSVLITVADVRRVRQACDVDLARLIDGGLKPLGELLGDPCKLVDIIFVLVKDQAEKKKLTDEDFGRAMAGDALSAAAEAFVEALVDFFPHKQQTPLRDVIQKGKRVAELTAASLTAKLAAIDPEKAARELMDKAEKSAAESSDSALSPSAPAVQSIAVEPPSEPATSSPASPA